MPGEKTHMQGRKTHEQQLRTLERKSDVPDRRQTEAAQQDGSGDRSRTARQDVRPTEFPVSRGGLNQEDRDHNKHHDPGQAGHTRQRHSPAEEKH